MALSQYVWTAAASIERAVETLVSDEDAAEHLAQRLHFLAENPIDVNSADASEMEEIPWILRAHATAIVSRRERIGAFSVWEELEEIDAIPIEVLALARPFLQIRASNQSSTSVGAVRRTIRVGVIQRVTRRLDLGRGYSPDSARTTYVGRPARVYSRIEASLNDWLTIAIAAEKDPGERFVWSRATRRYGFDHVAGHVAVTGVGVLQTLVVGNFTPEFGHGLSLSRGGSIGGTGTIGVEKLGTGIRRFASTAETGYLRGVGVSIGGARLRLHLLSSRRRRDATVDEASGVVTSIAESGLHRTASELSRRQRIREAVIAGAVEWRADVLSLGVAGYSSRFSQPVDLENATFSRFAFSGDRSASASVYARLSTSPIAVGVESALVPGSRPAIAASATAQLGRSVELAVATRAYPKEFAALHGSGPGQSGRPQNEFGASLALLLTPSRSLSIAAAVDQYRFPWPRFGVALPSSGVEAFVRAEYSPRHWVRLRLMRRTESRERTAVVRASSTTIDGVRDEVRKSMRFDLTFSFSDHLALFGRVEAVRHIAGSNSTRGFLLYEGVQYDRGAVHLDARLTFFDVNDFDARVYSYERDLRYAFAAPAYSGAGRRYHLLVTYSVRSGATLQLKFSSTQYLGVDTIGSGTEEIIGSTVRELRTQLVLRL